MLKILKKYKHWALLAPLFMLGEIWMDLLQPNFMAKIVDDGVLGGDLEVVIKIGIRMILLVIFGAFCGIMSGVFANLAGQNFGNDLRKQLFGKIMHLSVEQTDKFSTGSLVTRLGNDVQQVQQVVMMSVRGLIRSGTMFLGGIFMLYMQAPKFALIVGVSLPLVVLIVVFFMKKASPLFSVVQSKLDGINSIMQENVAGARVVKAYVKEEDELDKFDRANDDYNKINLRVQTLLAYMHPALNIILNICVIAVLYIGGITVKRGDGLMPGEIMAAITYVSMILNSVMFLANMFQIFTRAKASAERIREVLNCEDVVTDGPLANVPREGGRVEFRNVSFAYPNSNGEKVLDGVSFTLEPGQTLGIIGATGSGKSTLVNLIPRFYDATEGKVLIDGTDVRDYKLEDLRSRVSMVLQTPELYSRPIEANIRWGKDGAEPEEIKKAAVLAQADSFIMSTPNAYYTQVAERGHSLSGGQKQRLSIARALLKDHEILIFDDASSALDLKTEADLYSALNKEMPDTTKIIIAQRIASIKGADRIAVLDRGKIADIGTHEELLEKSEIYKEICYSQLREGGEENV